MATVGGLKEPPAPPSLNVTLKPDTGFPLLVASTVSGVGSAVPPIAVWLLPPSCARVCTAAVSLKVAEV